MYLIGIDEAGYGPNLGPLVVGGSVWLINDETLDLYEALSSAVSRVPSNDGRLAICDSKVLNRGDDGLRALEENVLPLMLACQPTAAPDWPWLLSFLESIEFPDHREFQSQLSLWDSESRVVCAPEDMSDRYFSPSRELHFPCAAESLRVQTSWTFFREQQSDTSPTLLAIRGVSILPCQFNRLVEQLGNKSTVLSVASLLLVRSLLKPVPAGERVLVYCDKHGGRNRYRSLIDSIFDPDSIEVLKESAEESHYRWSGSNDSGEIRFTAKGEGALPTALASMFAKYFREVVMMQWNGYWSEQVADLKPTKGYPVDAARFLEEIRPHLLSRNIELNSIWRTR